MHIWEQLFTDHGLEAALAALTFFIFIVIFSTLKEKRF